MVAFCVSPTSGVSLGADGTSIAGYTPGTVVNLSDGGQAIYVRATSEISAFAAVVIDASAGARMVTTTLAVANKRIGFAQCSIASAFYGWVQTGGAPKVNLAANCAPNVPLYTTATSGVLDDATVSAAMVARVAPALPVLAAQAWAATPATPGRTRHPAPPIATPRARAASSAWAPGCRAARSSLPTEASARPAGTSRAPSASRT